MERTLDIQCKYHPFNPAYLDPKDREHQRNQFIGRALRKIWRYYQSGSLRDHLRVLDGGTRTLRKDGQHRHMRREAWDKCIQLICAFLHHLDLATLQVGKPVATYEGIKIKPMSIIDMAEELGMDREAAYNASRLLTLHGPFKYQAMIDVFPATKEHPLERYRARPYVKWIQPAFFRCIGLGPELRKAHLKAKRKRAHVDRQVQSIRADCRDANHEQEKNLWSAHRKQRGIPPKYRHRLAPDDQTPLEQPSKRHRQTIDEIFVKELNNVPDYKNRDEAFAGMGKQFGIAPKKPPP